MIKRIEIPTGIDSYDDEILIRNADYDVLNTIASQYDCGERWAEMQGKAFDQMSVDSTLGDFDNACSEIAEQFNNQ